MTTGTTPPAWVDVDRRPAWPLAPLAPVLTALAVGIAIDRFASPWGTRAWTFGLFGLLAGSVLTSRLPRASAALLCGAILAGGGGYHHWRWTDLAPDDLAAVLDENPRPAWVRGHVEEVIGVKALEGRSPGEAGRMRTRFTLKVEAVSDAGAFRAASGEADVSVDGDRSDLYAGMPVLVAGRLARVAGPLNPGEFDYRAYLQAQGIRLRMSVDEPSGVALDPDARPSWSVGWVGALREASRANLVGRLDPRTAALATALVLGRRDEIDPDLNEAFSATGTSHLLAVSGLQLQALAWTLGFLFMAFGVPRRPRYFLVALCALGYAGLVGFSPSVTRSTVMTVAFCAAAIVEREPRPANTLALAGVLTLLVNPAYLFDVGSQLSFLAVGALFWLLAPAGRIAAKALAAVRDRTVGPPSPLDDLDPWGRSIPVRAWRWTTRQVFQGILVSAVVWVAAVPLVALRFHIVAPIGILLNVPLVPMTTLAMLLGAAELGSAAVGFPTGGSFAIPAGYLLRATEACVVWGAARPWGRWYTPGPAWGAVAAFQVLLGVAVYLGFAGPKAYARRRAAWAWPLLLAWFVPGWFVWCSGPRPESLEADVLAVGHGLAVVLQTPEGTASLYDCGRLDDPSVGRRIIAPALWSRGVSRIESVFLSHADQDHFDGLPDLLERFAIGEVVTPAGFADGSNPAATEIVRAIHAAGVPVREAAAPAAWELGSARLAILHPPEGWRPDAPDNARSLVVEASSRGRRLLLTGDLEGPGLDALLRQPPPEPGVDAMLSPHHGGKTANPKRLYDWANPGLVVVSQRPPIPGAADALVLPDGPSFPLWRTWKAGAVRLRWTPSGIEASGFLPDSAPETTGTAPGR